MIIIKKKNQSSFLDIFKKLFSKLIFLTGSLTIIFTFFVIFYYFSSGMHQRFKPLLLFQKIDEVIFEKYLGFSTYKVDDYLKVKLSSLKYIFLNNDLENLNIKINQKNLYNLELQRQKKIEGTSENFNLYSIGTLNYNKEDYPIKLRVKGDRVLHWYDKNQTSYKIDLRGPKRVWGMEEFSVQKPITRNYTYEFIFHKLLEFSNLISLKYFFVNLSLNDTEQGIYAVEEGFSKELIERNKKRNGPIFGVEENLGVTYPNIQYDLYSQNYWLKNYPELTSNAIAKLNQLKKDEIEVETIFDLEKWANFFAVIDFSNTLHGSISKSVKLYYNPVTGKFEPIGFDGHFGLGTVNDFIILDFLDLDNKKCSYICVERNWYNKFLKKIDGTLNYEFINLYIEALKKISSKKYLEEFNLKYSKEIDFYNSQLLSDVTKSDQGYYKGIGIFIYDENYLYNRSRYIENRLSQITNVENLQSSLEGNTLFFDNINKFFFKELNIRCKDGTNKNVFILKNQNLLFDKNCNYKIGDQNIEPKKNIFVSTKIDNDFDQFKDLLEFKEIEYKNGFYILDKDIVINKNYHFSKNKKLIIKEGTNIDILNDSLITSEGSILFEGTEKNPITIKSSDGKGSLILSHNKYIINFVKFENLSYPKDKSKILHGGLNVINSDLEIINSEVKSSNGEDGINIVSSMSLIQNLKASNIKSDAIDIDFGKLKFDNIYCENILNDCLDVSGSYVEGENLVANKVLDKGLSFGENSIGTISKTSFKNNKLGVAVKDGSKLELIDSQLIDNDFDIAVFNKKKEYEGSTLKLNRVNNLDQLNILLGNKNKIISNSIQNIDKIKNSYINNLFY